MFIENVIAFGNFKPGDQVLIPDEAEFDHYHFRKVAEKPPTPKPEVKQPDKEPENKEPDVTVTAAPKPEPTKD